MSCRETATEAEKGVGNSENFQRSNFKLSQELTLELKKKEVKVKYL
jgi:hypothetical protein